ncbi:hypothetical protein QUF74_03380 [Candidatus Halobeggiatoa sp. HSG11]|nr:hypothetical protein [Candidatus Halobeggiatoa sp. HSG11]
MKKIIEKVGGNKFANGLAIIIGIGAVVLPIVTFLVWWFWEQILKIPLLIWLPIFIIIILSIFLFYKIKQTQIEPEVDKFIPKKPEYLPFDTQGCITDADDFFGRELLLKNIFTNLERGSNLSLIGESKVGKSSLLNYVVKVGPEKLEWPKENFIYLDMQNVRDENDFFTALCAEIGIEKTQGHNLVRKLKGNRFILCLDEIEKMTNSDKFSGEERTELSGLAGGQDLPLTLLIASRSSLENLFPDSPLMTSPLANVCEKVDILPFSKSEVEGFIAKRLLPTKIQFSDDEIADINEQSQGHPAEVQKLAKRLYQEKS